MSSSIEDPREKFYLLTREMYPGRSDAEHDALHGLARLIGTVTAVALQSADVPALELFRFSNGPENVGGNIAYLRLFSQTEKQRAVNGVIEYARALDLPLFNGSPFAQETRRHGLTVFTTGPASLYRCANLWVGCRILSARETATPDETPLGEIDI